MKVLHLPGRAIWGYSEDEIDDILTYFEPDITLTSDVREKERMMIERNFSYESIHMDDLSSFNERYLGNEVLLLLKEKHSLSNMNFEDYRDRRVVLITDMIKEDMDPKKFDFQLINTSVLDRFERELEDFNVLSTKIETGKKPVYNKNRIYGFGLSRGIEEIKIPSVVTGKRPHIETLNANKVGLSAVPGLGKRFSRELERRGIESRQDLCFLDPSKILDCEGIGPYRSTKWISSAKAIEDKDVYRIKKNDLEDKHRIFIDIETDSLKPSIIWHIGLYDDRTGEYRSFLEKDPREKGRIIEQFLDYLEANVEAGSILLAWYGKKFDFEHLGRFVERYAPERKPLWDKIQKIDFMYWVDKHAALPCRSSKLESVASRLGYEPDLVGLDGGDVGRIYSTYMEDMSKEPDWNELKTYARDDVVAMKYIYDKVKEAPILYDMDEVNKQYLR
ncbi:MAG: ribonuclease H-like domain-containing protein [Candidatus Thermoplasmatota archaeon]|nr:ribonuclease H-like domain-containing protein [Candidatus Thermoplasmatota archaeon]